MARIRIPLSGELPHFSLKADLDGVPFGLAFQWSARARRWAVSLLDEVEAQAYSLGRPLTVIGRWMDQDVLNELTVRRFRRVYDLARGRLPGLLYASSPAPLTGTMADLDTVDLVYIDASEVSPWLRV
jgi:hypothetical protein